MSTMLLIRAKLAANLLHTIGEADYVEGLTNDTKALAEGDAGGITPEVEQICLLYDWIETTRQDYLTLRAKVNAFLESQGEETDISP